MAIQDDVMTEAVLQAILRELGGEARIRRHHWEAVTWDGRISVRGTPDMVIVRYEPTPVPGPPDEK